MHNEQIDQWRRAMLQKLSAAEVEELESHLRDAMAGFVAAGRTEAEAFDLATKRLGNADTIASEFAKANGTWWAIKMALVMAALLTLGSFVALMSIGFSARPLNWLLATHVFAATIGYVGTLLVGAVGICYVLQRCFRDFSPTSQQSIARSVTRFASVALVVTLIAVALGMLWAKLAWGRYWAWDPREIGALAIVVWLSLFIALGKTGIVTPRNLMLLAIIGNIVVSCGWFGSIMIQSRQYTGLNAIAFQFMTIANLVAFGLGLTSAGWARIRSAN